MGESNKPEIQLINADSKAFFRDFTRQEGDVVISDPPFNVKYHYDNYKDNLPKEEWLDLLAEVCAPPCVVILYPEMVFEFAARLGMTPTKCVSWVYPSNTPRQHRMIAWFGVKPDFTKVGQPYKNPTDKRIAKRIAEGKEARLYDWWEVNQVKNVSAEKTAHPCQMPFEVMRRVVGITPCDRVLEPFAGSGTTLLAAKHWGKDAVGVELNPDYCEVAEQRLRGDGSLF